MTASITSTITATITGTIQPENGGDPILAADHPDLALNYDIDDRSGVTINDRTTNGKNGTAGSGITFPTGVAGDTAKSDGVAINGIISVPALGLSGAAPRAFTFLVKPSATAFRAFFAIEAPNVIGGLWYFGLSGSGVGDIFLDTSTYGVHSAAGLIDTTKEYHCGINYKGGNLSTGVEFWVDGVKSTTTLFAGDGTPNTPDNTGVMFENHTNGNVYPDQLDEFKPWLRALTDAEMIAITTQYT